MAFKAPCDCHAVAGLKAYFPNQSGVITNQTFLFTDAHGNNLTGIGNLFQTGAIVKAILNLDEGKAYLQNADTNAYLEGKIADVQTAATNAAAAASNAQTTANSKAPMYTYGTTDLTAGSSALTTGTMYLCYE